jgi:hypothetical protein
VLLFLPGLGGACVSPRLGGCCVINQAWGELWYQPGFGGAVVSTRLGGSCGINQALGELWYQPGLGGAVVSTRLGGFEKTALGPDSVGVGVGPGRGVLTRALQRGRTLCGSVNTRHSHAVEAKGGGEAREDHGVRGVPLSHAEVEEVLDSEDGSAGHRPLTPAFSLHTSFSTNYLGTTLLSGGSRVHPKLQTGLHALVAVSTST